ncbi:hypothetical protein FJZ18_04415 [Candidatus Pacearchaeota archaeon]|nr:hypothetical protein [Candidatus Pacearchaeota archaeon]
MEKRGISPVIATVILVLITIIIAVIILLWARGYIGESIEKSFGGKTEPIERFCGELDFVADIVVNPSNDKSLLIDVTNRKDVPIYGFEVKKVMSSSKTKVAPLAIASDFAVTSGETERITVSSEQRFSPGNEFSLAPALLGEVESGSYKKFYICDDKYGVQERAT